MDLGEDFARFIAPRAERLVALAGLLAARDLPYSVLRTGAARHVAVRLGTGAPRLIMMAHYDRAPGSPGVLDNSCACLELADFAQRVSRMPPPVPSILVVFSDLEEAPGEGRATDQGALALARAILGSQAVGDAPPPVLVLDVTGRGDRLVLSKAATDLLERAGRGASRAARAQQSTAALCREAARQAGLAEPLSLPLPWSDDLGLSLGGLGALTASLLPEDEALSLAAAQGTVPRTWACLHSQDDSMDLVEASALDLMAAFLDRIALLLRA
jgi:hypothetical protein